MAIYNRGDRLTYLSDGTMGGKNTDCKAELVIFATVARTEYIRNTH